MKILVLDEWIPYPLVSGKRLRSYHLLTRAARSHDITYLCFEDRGQEDEARKHIESLGIKVVSLQRRNPFASAHRLYWNAAANLFTRTPLVMRKHFREDFLQLSNQLLREGNFDLVHCEWTHYGIYAGQLAGRPRFLSSHNIEAMPWERLYLHEKNPVKKALLKLEWKKMLGFEQEVCQQFDHVGAVSEDDKEKFIRLYGCDSVTVIPNGIEVNYYDFALPQPAVKTLVFSASFDAFVNQDAVVYFMDSVFPRLLERVPDLRVVFLGKDPPSSLRKYESRNVSFTGMVEDVRPHLSQRSACIVPVRVAGGSRIKILEAMAAGLPVVSTPEGAEGLNVHHGEHLLIARTEQEFVKLVLRCLSNRELVQQLCTRARKLVEEKYDWERIAPLLERAWEETVRRFSREK
ncbi:MAG: glycosyltransferase [Candidatus Eiseniibacteriota bacterium]|nr:MAG: glycosyltransferase [Candidatus Eisenbacteria bacterium]